MMMMMMTMNILDTARHTSPQAKRQLRFVEVVNVVTKKAIDKIYDKTFKDHYWVLYLHAPPFQSIFTPFTNNYFTTST